MGNSSPTSNRSSRMSVDLPVRRILTRVTYVACRIGFECSARHPKTVLKTRDVSLARKKSLESFASHIMEVF